MYSTGSVLAHCDPRNTGSAPRGHDSFRSRPWLDARRGTGQPRSLHVPLGPQATLRRLERPVVRCNALLLLGRHRPHSDRFPCPAALTSASCKAQLRASAQLQLVAGEVAPHAKAIASILAVTSLAALHEAYPERPVYRFIPSLPVEVRRGAVGGKQC